VFGICGLFVCAVREFVLCVCVVALCLTSRSARVRFRKCEPHFRVLSSCALVPCVGFVCWFCACVRASFVCLVYVFICVFTWSV